LKPIDLKMADIPCQEVPDLPDRVIASIIALNMVRRILARAKGGPK